MLGLWPSTQHLKALHNLEESTDAIYTFKIQLRYPTLRQK